MNLGRDVNVVVLFILVAAAVALGWAVGQWAVRRVPGLSS